MRSIFNSLVLILLSSTTSMAFDYTDLMNRAKRQQALSPITNVDRIEYEDKDLYGIKLDGTLSAITTDTKESFQLELQANKKFILNFEGNYFTQKSIYGTWHLVPSNVIIMKSDDLEYKIRLRLLSDGVNGQFQSKQNNSGDFLIKFSNDNMALIRSNIKERSMLSYKLTKNILSDNKTNLKWVNNSNIANKKMNWLQAIDYVKDMKKNKYSGCKEWRLPSNSEMVGLSKLIRQIGINKYDIRSNLYWTFVSYELQPYHAVGVDINSGSYTLYNKDGNLNIWPVCGKVNPKDIPVKMRDVINNISAQ